MAKGKVDPKAIPFEHLLTEAGRISPGKLRELEELARLIDKAEAEAKRLKLIFEPDAGAVLAALLNGAQPGNGAPPVAYTEDRRVCPAWAKAFVERLGEAEAEAVRKSTEESVSYKLVI